MVETITLDGRKFRGISQALTANQNDYIQAHLRLAGAVELLDELGDVTRTEEQSADLVTQVLLSGQKNYILAGCLTEEGKVWNRTEADANAARFAATTDPEAKSLMHSSLVRFAIGFFSAKPLGHSSAGNLRNSFFRLGRRIGRIMLTSSPEVSEVSGRQPRPEWVN
ncbi:MAG: hypothetical protein JWN63_2754 [Candidatus Acidoferrum typicum]|nr:hypothetical protein [Candidatus Acidoferrum typicum]